MKRNEKLQLAAAILFFALLIIGMKIATGQTPTLESETITAEASATAGIGASPAPTASVRLESTPIDQMKFITGAGAITATREYHGNGFTIPDPPTSIIFNGGVAGEWLTVERHNKPAHDAKGFDPSYTTITSDFKPTAKKRPDGKWVISFESELNH